MKNYKLKHYKKEYETYFNPKTKSKNIFILKHKYTLTLKEVQKRITNQYPHIVQEQYLRCGELLECRTTKYPFLRGKQNCRSIGTFKIQLTYAKFFMWMNRLIIKEMYDDGLSTRDINKYVKEKYDLVIFSNHLKLDYRNKSESLICARDKMLNNWMSTVRGKVSKFTDKELTDTEVRKFNRNILNSPFEFRKNNLSWEEIEQKCDTKFDKITRKFIDDYAKNNILDFNTYFLGKSQTEILRESMLDHQLGKKIIKYFGMERIKQELKKFYNNYKQSRTITLKNTGTIISCYIGYIDGNLVKSMMEAHICAILIDNNINVITNKRYEPKIHSSYIFDFYLPEYNLYLEFDDSFDSSDKKRRIQKHEYLCEKFNIIVFDNLKMDAIINILSEKLNRPISNKILHPIIVNK